MKGEKIMTKEEYIELKEQLGEVMMKIEGLKHNLNMLYREKKTLEDKIVGYEGCPLSTNIEYLFSRFDLERSEHYCSRATVTKAKKLLLNNGYTDLRQLEGKRFAEFMELCDGTKLMAVILAYCYKCNVKMDMRNASPQKNQRMESIKYEAIWFMDYIVF